MASQFLCCIHGKTAGTEEEESQGIFMLHFLQQHPWPSLGSTEALFCKQKLLMAVTYRTQQVKHSFPFASTPLTTGAGEGEVFSSAINRRAHNFTHHTNKLGGCKGLFPTAPSFWDTQLCKRSIYVSLQILKYLPLPNLYENLYLQRSFRPAFKSALIKQILYTISYMKLYLIV